MTGKNSYGNGYNAYGRPTYPVGARVIARDDTPDYRWHNGVIRRYVRTDDETKRPIYEVEIGPNLILTTQEILWEDLDKRAKI
jgi:hypothetical protein